MNALAQRPHPALKGYPPELIQCQHVMALAGWEIEYVDLDFTRPQPTAELKLTRADDRWLWAKVDTLGRCTIETFHRARKLGMAPNQNGLRPMVPIVEDIFLGRQHLAGPRQMMRQVTNYLADNALAHVPLPDIRAAWAGLMTAPIHRPSALH